MTILAEITFDIVLDADELLSGSHRFSLLFRITHGGAPCVSSAIICRVIASCCGPT